MIYHPDIVLLSFIALLSGAPLISYPLSIQKIEIVSQSTPVRNLAPGETVYIVAIIQNSGSQTQDFSYITEVIDERGFTVDIKWFDGSVAGMQSARLSNTWTSEEAGIYTVKVMVWNNIDASPSALAELKTTILRISCIPPC